MPSVKDALAVAGITPRRIHRGGVYLVSDGVVVIPPRTAKRSMHKWRTVVVLQSQDDCDSPTRVTVLCAPTSASGAKAATDYDLPAGAGGLERDSVVLLGLLQPIAKTDLGAELGRLDSDTVDRLHTVIMVNLGILPRPEM